MKKIYPALIVLLCFVIKGYAQHNFKPVKFDDVITISFPGDVVELDTVVDNIRTYQLFSNTGNELFMMQKLSMESIYNSKEQRPEDKESLLKAYHKFAGGYVEGMERSYKILDTSEINIAGFTGLNVRMKHGKRIVAQANLLYLGEQAYVFFYHNAEDYNKENAEKFLNSINFAANSPAQFTEDDNENDIAYKIGEGIGYLLVLGFIVGFVLVIVFIIRKIMKK